MDRIHGFSITEVLVSLFLITSLSLALITHQWKISRLFNQLQLRSHAGIQLDNASEEALLTGSISHPPSFYQRYYKQQHYQAIVQVEWDALDGKYQDKQSITRALIVS